MEALVASYDAARGSGADRAVLDRLAHGISRFFAHTAQGGAALAPQAAPRLADAVAKRPPPAGFSEAGAAKVNRLLAMRGRDVDCFICGEKVSRWVAPCARARVGRAKPPSPSPARPCARC
jgi:hypothetical protein